MHIFPNLIFIILTLSVVCCGRSAEKDEAGRSVLEADSVPETIKILVREISNDDVEAFARHISYPIKRPYPLRDIENAEQMKAYYPRLVDDSLKRAIVGSKAEDWEEYGWRGWAVHDGRYLWIDSLVYDIPYVSRLENAELQELREKDMASLSPRYRGHWIPVAALESADGRIFRIDSRPDMDFSQPASLRMLIFSKGANLSKDVADRLEGSLNVEGSELSEEYVFADNKGNQYVLDMESADEGTPTIFITTPSGETVNVGVKSAYWLDLIQSKQ